MSKILISLCALVLISCASKESKEDDDFYLTPDGKKIVPNEVENHILMSCADKYFAKGVTIGNKRVRSWEKAKVTVMHYLLDSIPDYPNKRLKKFGAWFDDFKTIQKEISLCKDELLDDKQP